MCLHFQWFTRKSFNNAITIFLYISLICFLYCCLLSLNSASEHCLFTRFERISVYFFSLSQHTCSHQLSLFILILFVLKINVKYLFNFMRNSLRFFKDNVRIVKKIKIKYQWQVMNFFQFCCLSKRRKCKTFRPNYLYLTKIVCFCSLLFDERNRNIIIEPMEGKTLLLLNYFIGLQKREARS